MVDPCIWNKDKADDDNVMINVQTRVGEMSDIGDEELDTISMKTSVIISLEGNCNNASVDNLPIPFYLLHSSYIEKLLKKIFPTASKVWSLIIISFFTCQALPLDKNLAR